MARKKNQIVEDGIVNGEDLCEALEADDISDYVEEFISTGSTLLDYAISNRKDGGIPVGRVTELIGENQSGKTLICTHIAANVQKKNGVVIFIDTEHDLDRAFAIRIGVNLDKFIYKENVDSMEGVFEYIEKVIKHIRTNYRDKLFVIIWDGIAATPARQELEGDYNPATSVGVHARIMHRAIRKIRWTIKKERIALICTNQIKLKINAGYSDPRTTSGGSAMKYCSSVRIDLAPHKKIKDIFENVLGVENSAKVIKNKIGPPFRSVKFPVMYDYGIDDVGSWLKFMIECDVVKGEAWKTIDVNGKEYKFRTKEWNKLVEDNKDVKDFILEQIDKKMVIKYDTKNTENDIELVMEDIKED